MKSSNKSSLLTGIILLSLSAVFTICLLIQLLNFGASGPGQNIFFNLGLMLVSVYGISSSLIPVFLFIAGLSCFATTWTSQKTMRLLTAIIPFFTIVLTEKIVRSILNLDYSSSTIIKVVITIVTGIILCIVEILVVSFIAESINQRIFHSERTKTTDYSNTSKSLKRPKLKSLSNKFLTAKNHKSKQEDEFVFVDETPQEEQTIQKAEKTPLKEEIEIIEEKSQEKEIPESITEETANPSSIITQEEYNALINPKKEPEIEELEWNNLPPAPESLPPEYTEEIDESDPALEFPPQEQKYPTRIILDEGPEQKNITKEPENKEPSIDPDFFDIDLNSDLDEETSEDEESDESEIKDPTIGFSTGTSSVFSQMDDDILNNQLEDESENPNKGATNLTKDDLTDFFNAQQKENTPSTKEIHANPPKIGNRATKKGPYVIPSDLLTAYKDDQYWIIDDETKQASVNLKQTLSEFNIDAEIIGIKKGPVVTMFEILPAPGVKLSKIVALQDNIALSLAAQSVRIVAPIPGKQAVGIEVPNKNRSVVGFREIIEMDLPEWNKMAVPVILGKDILGKAQLIDLVKTPHMLIAGATGSGKSVCVNSLILSILYKRSYQDVKMILVDPKVVELKLYNNIPHLLTPVITEPKKALQALQYCLCEMERRYALLDGMGVRDISTYNQKIKEKNICTEKLPYIVVIIDEFADLMATSGKELESVIARLTAMSRAVGIHLVLATQRPSVNVITGLIKANIPSRIAFMVASRTDSNIIIDSVGAEKLLGRGDMLYASAVDPYPVRIQGTFVSDQEVENVVNAVKEYGEPDYIDDEIFIEDDDDIEGGVDLFGNSYSDEDPLYDQALEIVVQAGKASASYIQRRLKIGYNRAARLVEEMEERGIVGPANGSKPREIIHMP
ncbi:MAG: hypothetical protein IKX23_01760 [Treponema sp.]|nr:hypothetical protein [Treponema sp.]